MGRGRAKAKQTKVARQLKYNSPDMDLASLQRELSNQQPTTQWEDDDNLDYADAYAEYLEEEDED